MSTSRSQDPHHARLREAIEEAVVTRAGIDGVEPKNVASLLALVSASDHGRAICMQLQRTAVDQARRSGASWSAVGETLGVSRQAAQQRFAAGDDDSDTDTPTRRIYGATAFNEMHILEAEGEAGYHLVDFGRLCLVVKPSQQAWKHRREVALNIAGTRNRLERAGWRYIGTWFPFHYFKRVDPERKPTLNPMEK